MTIKMFLACACGALTLSFFAAPAPEDEKGPLYTVKENGYVLLTESVIQKVIAKDFELRRKLADPRYYKDVQGNFKDLLRELYADPFDGRLVATNKSLPEQEQAELWDIWKAYEAYMRRCEMRKALASLLSFYDGRSMFRYTARVERAQDFYKSDRMKKLLHDMKMFDSTFHQLDKSVARRYEEGETFGKRYQSRVTLSDLFDGETIFGTYVSAEGTPKSSFWNSLIVLMRYNARMCDDELKKMKAASDEVNIKIEHVMDAHQKAISAASFYKNGYPALAGIVELDERIIDCVTAAVCDLTGTIKKFEDTSTDAFNLRSGLPCARVFAATGVDTDRKEGPDYCELVTSAYDYLRKKFGGMCVRRHEKRMELK